MSTTPVTILRRPVAALALIGLMACVSRTAAAEEEGGIWVGPLNLSPTLSVGVFYDSNPDEVNENRKRLMEEEVGKRYDSAEGFNIQPGLNFRLPGNGWSLSGRLTYTYEDDNSDFTRSPKDWRESVKFEGETDGGTSWSLGQSAQQISYQQFDEFSQDDRFSFGVYGSLGRRLTEKNSLIAGASYRFTDYEDDYLYDSSDQNYSLTYKHQLTEKTDGLLSLEYGINSADFDEVGSDEHPGTGPRRRLNVDIEDATYITGSVGLGSRATEKLRYQATVGLTAFNDHEYKYPENPELDYDPDTEYSFSYNMGMAWTPTERFKLNLSGQSSYESAEDVRNSSLLAYTLSCSASYRFFTRLVLSGGAAYRYEDYTRDITEDEVDLFRGTDVAGKGKSRQDDQFNLFAGLTFGVTRYASFYLNGLYTVTESSIDDFDYDRYRITAGVALQY
ncbi:MAG: outer membrane beta-barrel protein [Lentisphaerae bacterium]|jgi:hypothetical protein|nr:outer membrane beta-barrel protein [Lentisphaerota bacterium]